MSDIYDAGRDRWSIQALQGPSMPARRAIAITPSDTKDVTNATGDNAVKYASAIYVGVSGDMVIIAAGDTIGVPVTFKSVPVGWFPVQVRRVMFTGTSATNIVGLYD